MDNEHKISLGFTSHLFEPGTHACQIISDDQERQDAAMSFLISGLTGGERTACFSDRFMEGPLADSLEKLGISYLDACSNGDFLRSATADVYFKEGVFDPDRTLKLLEDYYWQSKASNYTNARVIGEMNPDIERVSGGERLFEYECRVSMLVKKVPVTAVCQYDAKAFDGAVIMDVLKVHPFMIIRGEVVHNPFFVPPEEYLESHGFSCECCGNNKK